MDHLEAVGNLLYLYGLTKLPSLPREMHELVNVLDQQAKITAEAMPRLRVDEGPRGVLDRDATGSRTRATGRTGCCWSGSSPASTTRCTVLKMKEVADELEAACDAFEHVANTVETIAVKES